MRRISRTTRGLIVATGLAASSFLLIGTAWASGWCCATDSNYTGCVGCVAILSNPARYVHVGQNVVKYCVNVPGTTNCGTEPKDCYSLVDTPLYSDPNCSDQVGVTTVRQSIAQCTVTSDSCGE